MLQDHVVTRNSIASLLFLAAVSAFAANGTSVAGNGDWRIYSQEANGNVHFYDASRVSRTSSLHTVWQRTRYKNSVMAASSYQSLLEIDCSERTERTLQRTFYSDRNWEDPAMSTDMKPKSKRSIRDGSATQHLAEILCDG